MKPVVSGLKDALIFKHSAVRALAARVIIILSTNFYKLQSQIGYSVGINTKISAASSSLNQSSIPLD